MSSKAVLNASKTHGASDACRSGIENIKIMKFACFVHCRSSLQTMFACTFAAAAY